MAANEFWGDSEDFIYKKKYIHVSGSYTILIKVVYFGIDSKKRTLTLPSGHCTLCHKSGKDHCYSVALVRE
jgi:hypothetical protein